MDNQIITNRTNFQHQTARSDADMIFSTKKYHI